MKSEIIKPNKVNRFRHPFGIIYELSTSKNSSALNIARAKIKDDIRHYHKKATEIYHMINGVGTIELDDKEYRIAKGYTIVIKPLTRHRIKPDKGILDFFVASSPPYNPKDEFYD